MAMNFIKAILSGIIAYYTIKVIQVMATDLEMILSHGVNMSAQEFLMLLSYEVLILWTWYGSYHIMTKD